MRGLPPIVLLIIATSLLLPAASAQGGPVMVAEIQGEITRATVEYVKAAVEVAAAENARALVFRLETPGGGLAETLEIQRLFLSSPVPIVGWVAPSGVSAWSAGTILLMSTDYAAMAPFTVIGSVQPVSVGGEPVQDSKILNAIVKSVSEQLVIHGRNVTVTVGGELMPLADAFVRRNLNLNASESLSLGAIEAVAATVEDLVASANGFAFPLTLLEAAPQKPASLDLAGARIETFQTPPGVAFLSIVANPIISGLLLLLGIYAVIFGISAPGHGSEIAGVVMIALGVLGLGFSVNIVGIFLLILGIALMIVEIKTPGFGVFGVSGIVCLVLATLFLAPIAPPQFLLTRDAQLAILAALLTPTAAFGAFLLFALYKVIEVRNKKPVVGRLIGEEAEAIDPIPARGRGYVRFAGEMWLATSEADVVPGEKVRITAKEGIVLLVEKGAVSRPEEPGDSA